MAVEGIKRKSVRAGITVIIFFLLLVSSRALAWSEHPLLVYPVLKDLPLWEQQPMVSATSLKSFLIACENELEQFFARHEEWSRKNLPHYAPCPEELRFKATGNADDILQRFYQAIRINPHVKIPLYLHLIPGYDTMGRPVAAATNITTLSDTTSMQHTTYVWITEGEKVAPLHVLCTATDEPDYGFDLGLFEDNQTDYGKRYGFGKQAFGNPNLEYSSQAPFHMGFYHESRILYKFGPFLNDTFIDYRIFLYKALSEFAFANDQPYWGWRFMGWGMHYVGDVSMPYHMKPLPGVSTLRMLWINTKAMMGASRARDNAVQLVSNRHTVFEEFQHQALRKAYTKNDPKHPFFAALTSEVEPFEYTYHYLIEKASRDAANNGRQVDKALKKNVPHRMVSDPAIEVSDLPEMPRLMEVIAEEKGDGYVETLTLVIAGQMESFALHVRSFMESILAAQGD